MIMIVASVCGLCKYGAGEPVKVKWRRAFVNFSPRRASPSVPQALQVLVESEVKASERLCALVRCEYTYGT
jgi:hypothetical protein